MNLCEKDSCNILQNINIIGNSSTIYANMLYDIGRPLIKGVDEFQYF